MTYSMFLVLFLLGAFPWATGTALGASPISKELGEIAKDLTDGYKVKRPKAAKEPLAIFSFNSDERLAKQRMGFAVAELLTHKFTSLGAFVVVERAELHRVMEEQRLHLTGAIDPKTAVEIGKLLGAKVLLLGSVEKLGGNYQLNARLVYVETGEVLVTAYQELEAKLFEEEARSYLVLVPEQQAIGFYAVYNWRHNSNSLPAGTVTTSQGSQETQTPKAFNSALIGAGLRYFPAKHVLVDLAGMLYSGEPYATRGTGSQQRDHGSGEEGLSLRGLLNWTDDLTEAFRWYFGAGIISHTFGYGGGSYLSPMIRLGVEGRPQARFGVGLFLNYEFARKDIIERNAPEVAARRLNRLSIEPTVALYF